MEKHLTIPPRDTVSCYQHTNIHDQSDRTTHSSLGIPSSGSRIVMQDFRRGGSDDGETRQSCSAIRHLVVNTPVFMSNPITLTENTKGILADATKIFRKTGIASSMTILTRPLLKYDLLFSFTSTTLWSSCQRESACTCCPVRVAAMQ